MAPGSGRGRDVSVINLVVVVAALVLLGLCLAVPLTQRRNRALPPSVVEELESIPTSRANQHRVDLELGDGRIIRDVWVAWNTYPALVGGRTIRKRYRPSEVVHARPAAR
jgi:hypothetical protein